MAFKKGDKFILELGEEQKMFHEFEIAGTDLYVKTDLLEKLTQYAPTVQPERKTGKWIDNGQYGDNFPHHAWLCSECSEGVIEIDTPWYKFCPNCGADMRGEQE